MNHSLPAVVAEYRRQYQADPRTADRALPETRMDALIMELNAYRLLGKVDAMRHLARQHDLAIPLFQEAIELGSPSPHTYRWLAASLWATTRDLQPCWRG